MKKKDSEFYNRSIKLWLQNNGLEMYSTHSKWKSAVTERFISTLKSKYYNYMASVSKNIYLDDKVNKENNTFRSTNKMEFHGGKPSTVIDFEIVNLKLLTM